MSGFPAAFKTWRKPIEKKIDQTLETNFDRDEANQIIKYMFKTGGKRCRPLLVALAAEALGGDGEKSLDAAAAIEIIHAATLVFDDLIDKDQMRRGVPTIHMAFSNEKAITSGLFLASKGVQLLADYKNPEIMRMVGSSLVDVSKGELLDILSDFSASVNECVAIADLKTASLFGTAAGIGAAIAGANGRELAAMQKFGRSAGMAFQIRDDMLDFGDGSNKLSLSGPNIVTSHLLHEAPRPNNHSSLIDPKRRTSAKKMLRAVRDAGSMQYAGERARDYAKTAKDMLNGVKRLRNRKILEEYADYLWRRKE